MQFYLLQFSIADNNRVYNFICNITTCVCSSEYAYTQKHKCTKEYLCPFFVLFLFTEQSLMQYLI